MLYERISPPRGVIIREGVDVCRKFFENKKGCKPFTKRVRDDVQAMRGKSR